MNEQKSVEEKNQINEIEIIDVEVLTNEEYQERQADMLMQQTFGNEENMRKTSSVIASFVDSYEKHKRELPLQEWLVREFKKYPDIWKDEQDITNTAIEIITTVQEAKEKKESLYAHMDKGKSKESWLANEIEKSAKIAGATNVGAYAAEIDNAINQSNQAMIDTIVNKDGISINMGRNLDGFIAEQHHVDTFNLEAAAQGSGVRAKVLTPDGAYGKNSMDIGIYDENGKLVRRYQAKYGQDADATKVLFEKGDYKGQRKLVPSEQVNNVEGSVGEIEYNGIKSKPLSKADAKALQEKAQIEYEAKKYEWNDVNRINIAKEIGKGALLAAGATCAFQGARILGRRVWNALTGKENQSASEDLKEFFESSIKTGANVGATTAVAGGVVVAARNGWLGTIAKGMKANVITNAVVGGIENAKILYKFAKGELTGLEAADAMGTTTTSLIGGVYGFESGVAIGAAICAIGGPIGAAIGSIAGGIVGGIAGSKIGEKVYQAGKESVKTGVTIVKAAVKAAVEVGKSVVNGIKNVFKSLFS
ncbi:MAG: hypothetical protein EKK57_04245 [Proteobacteria bacterium]|nr:MAG: hypothetical protein EKK57_04245 [Pseudomonadota bacterium]